jgi:hypothetical protein
MLDISPKSFLKSTSHLGDPWMNRRGWLLIFGLEQLFLHLADSPPGRHRQSARPYVHRLFLHVCGSIHWRGCVSLHVVCGQSAWVSRAVRTAQVALGPSAGRVRTIRISRCGFVCSVSICGPSASQSRIVCLVTPDCSPGTLQFA